MSVMFCQSSLYMSVVGFCTYQVYSLCPWWWYLVCVIGDVTSTRPGVTILVNIVVCSVYMCGVWNWLSLLCDADSWRHTTRCPSLGCLGCRASFCFVRWFMVAIWIFDPFWGCGDLPVMIYLPVVILMCAICVHWCALCFSFICSRAMYFFVGATRAGAARFVAWRGLPVRGPARDTVVYGASLVVRV